ncbi:MAG: hypothetical protein J2P37_10600 [Ktedonobacteraceae bacterium]|nr:hypothetical protein [Ktedonobacteraceae bacterium]
MQGRQGKGDPRNRPPGQSVSPMNGTGRVRAVSPGKPEPDLLTGKIQAFTNEHRAMPQRPAGMRRLDTPPATPRVARPLRKEEEPKKLRRKFLVWGTAFVICAIIGGFVGYGVFQFFQGVSFSSGPSTVAVDFLDAVSKGNYDQAYLNLGPSITLKTGQDEFRQEGQALDTAYGTVQSYSEVKDSATQPDDHTMVFTYELKRGKIQKPYQIHITLSQTKDGGWKVSDYGSTLGPNQNSSGS